MALSYRERIERRIVIDTNGCWVWHGAIVPAGYGQMATTHGRAPIPVHRAAYMEWVGPIPDGHDLDHLCRVRSCCNPAHLEPVTRRENLRRGNGIGGSGSATFNLAKTHCPNGHPYDEINTYRHPQTGRRACVICRADAVRRYQANGKRQEYKRQWRARRRAAGLPPT